MISEIHIKNYKSIDEIALELGRINIFIGENGAGKSNILEAIALAAAATGDKLDNEFLASRGVRVTKPEHMRSAFDKDQSATPIQVIVKSAKGATAALTINNDNSPYAKWEHDLNISGVDLGLKTLTATVEKFLQGKALHAHEDKKSADELIKILDLIKVALKESQPKEGKDKSKGFSFPLSFAGESDITHRIARASLHESGLSKEFSDFVIYSPENSALRTFEREGQIEPLGINGEGLLKLLSFYTQAKVSNDNTLDKIKNSLKVLDWFSDFETVDSSQDRRIVVKDRYIDKNISDFDHKSTNEGFFFLLFYFCLFISKLTPRFFAVDNIDASLNPKLCQKLIMQICNLACENDKQAILTTHNPAVLDGLNLDDNEQRLFVISRARNGSTKVKRIKKPTPVLGKEPQKLSSLFLAGAIGGLPKGF